MQPEVFHLLFTPQMVQLLGLSYAEAMRPGVLEFHE